jgi:flagellin-like protein
MKAHFKGISPLLSVVLLVAVTIAVGAFVSSWMQNLAKQHAEESSRSVTAGCAYATLSLDEVVYTTTSNQIIIKVRASGTRNIDIDRITLINSSYDVASYINGVNFGVPTIEAGDVRYVVLNNVIENVTEIRVIPKDCEINAVTLEYDEFTVQ